MGCGKQVWIDAGSQVRLCNPACAEAAAHTSSGGGQISSLRTPSCGLSAVARLNNERRARLADHKHNVVGPSADGAFQFRGLSVQGATTGPACLRRQPITKPRPPMPANIIVQVAGSGTKAMVKFDGLYVSKPPPYEGPAKNSGKPP